MTRCSRTLLAAAALLLLSPDAALAQSGGEPPPADAAPAGTELDEIAQKHYADGRAAADRGDWQTAYTSFRAGYAIQIHPLILSALGTASHRLGKHQEAAEYLTLYLQNLPAGTTAAERAAAEKTLAEAKQQVGTLTISAPAGADVFIDHVLVGKAPLNREAFAEPGKRQIEARSGDELARQIVTVEKGKSATLTLVWGAPIPPPILTAAPTSTGTLAPIPTAVPTSTAPEGGPRRELIIAGASVAVGAALAGAVLLGVSRAKAGDEERLRTELVNLGTGNVCAGANRNPKCAEVRDAGGAADALTNSGAWLLIGAGAVGAATAIYYLIERKPASSQGALPSPPRATAGAFAGPGQGGASLTVRW